MTRHPLRHAPNYPRGDSTGLTADLVVVEGFGVRVGIFDGDALTFSADPKSARELGRALIDAADRLTDTKDAARRTGGNPL